MMKSWYRQAVYFLSKLLQDEKKVNGMDVLNDFVLENREIFSDIELSDLDDFVTNEYELFLQWLKNENYDWLIIEPAGIWHLKSQNDEPPRPREFPIQEKFNFTEDEKKLIEEEPYNLNAELVYDYVNLLKKLIGSGNSDKEIIFKCKYKLAVCAADSQKLTYKKVIYYWLEAADAASAVGNKHAAILCFVNAAKLQTRENEHKESADCYYSAFKIEENVSEKVQLARYARVQYELVGDHKMASEVFIEEKRVESSSYKSTARRFIWKFYEKLSLYGESPSRVIKSAAWLLLFCSIIVFINGTSVNESVYAIYTSSTGDLISRLGNSLVNSVYFSFVTFSTLGYGDVLPCNLLGKFISILLAVSGLFLTSLFMVTFVRKYSRS